jgi:hypothetical protein
VLLVGVAGAALAAPSAQLVLGGLNSPKGVDTTGKWTLLGQGAFGPPGPVLAVDGAGNVATLFGPKALVDIAVSPLDGTFWGLGSDRVLYHERAGNLARVRDISVYQKGDPDPNDVNGDPTGSNPYGLTVLPGGDALVSDAQNNDLVRVRPDGVARTVARFDTEMVSTSHLGDPNLPPEIPAEAVPTSVTVGPDGWVYVGELKGFPFRPGSSRIWRVNPDARGARCSVAVASSSCSSFASGFTSIEDLDFAPNGTAWVYELARGGVLAFEEGFQTGDFPPAVLLATSGPGLGIRREVAKGQLSQPGGVAVDPAGVVFVTDGMFSEGRLLKVTA